MQVQGDFLCECVCWFQVSAGGKGTGRSKVWCEFNNLPPLTLEANGSTDRLRL